MTYYLLTGEELNAIVPAATPPVMSPAADALYPATQLYDGKPYLAAKWGSVSAATVATADLNAIPWPGFESTTPPTATPYAGAWTNVTGTFSRDTSVKKSGAASLKLSVSLGKAYVDILVRAGQKRNIDWAIEGDGTVSARLEVINLSTGNALAPGGAWVPQPQNLDTQLPASFKVGSQQYQVESFAACQSPLVWLRIQVSRGSGAGQAYFDDLYDYPAIDTCLVFGTQNWDPVLSPEFHTSTDGFGANDIQQGPVPTNVKPVCYAMLPALLYIRHWRLKLTGTPRVAPGLGELIFGQSQTLLKAPNLAPTVTFEEAGQIRRGSISRAQRARNMGAWPLREVQLGWTFKDAPTFAQFLDEFWRGTRGGAIPAVLIATDLTQGLRYPIFGMLSESFAGKREGTTGQEIWQVTVSIEEQPFPNL